MYVEWDDRLGIDENMRNAAMAFAKKLNWDGLWVKGGLPDGTVIWVNSSEPHSKDVFHVAPKANAA